jgi:hypothetical protein
MFLKSGNTFHPFGIRYPEKNKVPNTKSISTNRKKRGKKRKNKFHLILNISKKYMYVTKFESNTYTFFYLYLRQMKVSYKIW